LTTTAIYVPVLFMDRDALAQAQEQALGIFADAVLKLALHIQQEALDAPELDQKVGAAVAIDRLGRGLRQTIALQAKLAREARREAAEPAPKPAAPPAEPATPPDPKAIAVRRRSDWLTRNVERCVWNEYERDDSAEEFTAESLLEDLSERLADLMADPEAFLALDPDALLVQLCQELGVTPPQFHPPAPTPAAPLPADSS
jgi:hypothetical protein